MPRQKKQFQSPHWKGGRWELIKCFAKYSRLIFQSNHVKYPNDLWFPTPALVIAKECAIHIHIHISTCSYPYAHIHILISLCSYPNVATWKMHVLKMVSLICLLVLCHSLFVHIRYIFFYFQDHFSGSGVVYEIVSNLPKVTKLMLVKDICFMCVSTCVCFHKHLFIYYCWSCVTAYMCFHTHVLFCYCLSSNSRHSQDVAQRKEGIMSCLTCYICKF